MSGLLIPIKYIIISKKKYQILWINSIKDEVNARSPQPLVKIPRREFTPETFFISSQNSPRKKSKSIVIPKKEMDSFLSVIEIKINRNSH